MAATATTIPLSGSSGGDLIALATYPTLTLVHTVPDGETHHIVMYGVNGDNTTGREILGNMGVGADLFDHTVPAETSQKIAEAVLVGPKTINLAKVSGSSVRVFGVVKRVMTGRG